MTKDKISENDTQITHPKTPLYTFKQESLQRLPQRWPLFKTSFKTTHKEPFQTIEEHHFKQLKSKASDLKK